MKITKSAACRLAVAAVGGVMLSAVATAAFADTTSPTDVDVNVSIAPVVVPGALTMTVASTSTSLTEATSTDPTIREFTGALPAVTVSDTRTTIPAGAAWAVLGQATAFTSQDNGGQPAISADHLGWEPSVVDPDATYAVLPGDKVDTVLDSGPNNVGLEGANGPELLAMVNTDSQTTQSVASSWTANANLFLKVPVGTAPGAYKSVLTLSLFE